MTPSERPFVTVIVPARNEENHIAACLRSILEGSYPTERLEILVVEGGSDDRTQEIVRGYSDRYANVFLLQNPARIVPHAMNIGIRAARGDLIVRVDAHAHYEKDYLTQLVSWMERLRADNVGGVIVTRPASNAPEARAVAIVLSHPFGVGNSLFRLEGLDSPVEVDTVPFGCYRRDVFERIGLYDEMFVRNQDDELNARLKKSGGRIFLVPEIRIDYVARDSLAKLARMLYQYGYFKPLIALKLRRPTTWRQLAPPVFTALTLGLPLLTLVSGAAALLWVATVLAHGSINLGVSARKAHHDGWQLLPYLFCGFLLAHLAYGAGYLRGAFDFGLLRRHLKEKVRDAPLSR